MKDESSGVVRRSSEEELLEMIKGDARSNCDYGLCGWVNLQLGVNSDFFARGVSDDEQQSLCRVFGPLRKNQPLLTESPQEFIRFVCKAYTDAVRYPEFTGIEIEADSVLVSSGVSDKTYCFEAKFPEMLGLTGLVYETKLSFEYLHSHEDREHNIENYVSEKLEDLRAGLLGKLKEAEIAIENKSLYISKK